MKLLCETIGEDYRHTLHIGEPAERPAQSAGAFKISADTWQFSPCSVNSVAVLLSAVSYIVMLF